MPFLLRAVMLNVVAPFCLVVCDDEKSLLTSTGGSTQAGVQPYPGALAYPTVSQQQQFYGSAQYGYLPGSTHNLPTGYPNVPTTTSAVGSQTKPAVQQQQQQVAML